MNRYIIKAVIFSFLILPGYIKSNTVLLHNNARWPIFVWPIPAKNNPYLLAKVPNKQPNTNKQVKVITTPAKLEWPGDAKAMIVVAEKHADEFVQALNETITDYNNKNKPADYDWTSHLRSTLTKNNNIPSSEWAIFYPRDSRMGHEVLLEKFTNYRLVVYNAPSGSSTDLGMLTGIAEPLGWNTGIEDRYGVK